jgi:hypothetical protein
MRKLTRNFTLSLLTAAAIFSSAAQALVISNDFSSLGSKPTPSQISWNFNTTGGSALLGFELAGFKSLDGFNNGGYTDIFHLLLNGTEIFTGSFNLGGGGSNTILYNPNGGSALTTTFNASDDPQNSHQVTWAGGLTQVTLPISLLLGANRVQFGYTGAFQSMQDESWGINLATITSAKVTKVVVPEPSTLVLLVAGLLSIVALRRKVV